MPSDLPFTRVHIPTVSKARSRLANAHKFNASHAAIEDARAVLQAAKLQQAIDREAPRLKPQHAAYLAARLAATVNEAPPLSDAQVAVLRPLLAQGPLA